MFDLWRCRKGAAYGLAGIVKGLRISAVNGFGILSTLLTALEDKVCPKAVGNQRLWK